MISRAQRLLFALLLLAVVVMAAILIRLREGAQDRLSAVVDDVPLTVPAGSASQKVTLFLANDLDDSLVEVERSYPMPQDENERARVLIGKLLAEYAAPKSPHPIADAAGLEEIYLMPTKGGRTAVVNLTESFVEAHPSGIEPETLTLLSIISTLHANIPSITEVRFLVDGRERQTLAGHADLTRIYLATDTTPAGPEPRAAQP
ncbi:MAG: GerMN domain-containing protein [Acidobacteria bacterium]|nr:GerMN domain-containing protein [Acidobacteriota bacterium]MBW4045270.1 GerMN domain-containing protein [Acidobacteriota bacterium]